MHDRALGDKSLLEQRVDQLLLKNKEQVDQSVELAERNTQMGVELKMKGDEVQRLKQDLVRGMKVKDGLSKKLRSAEEARSELEGQRESLKQQISSLEKG